MKEMFFLIDIGTTFLKGISFLIAQDKEAKVIDFVKLSCDLQKKGEFKNKLGDLVHALKKNDYKIKTIFITAGDGVGTGKLMETKIFRKNKDKKITEAEFKKILKETQQESSLLAKKEFSSQRIKIVNSNIQKIIVDKILVDNPIGMQGREIFLRIINFYLPFTIYKETKNILKTDLVFFYSPQLIPSALACFQGGSEVFIDFGEKNTQIIFSKNKEIEDIKIIKMGGEYFFEKISDGLKISRNDMVLGCDAQEIILKFKRNILSPEIERQIECIIGREYEKWQKKIEVTLKEVKDWALPKHIYIFGGGSRFLFFDKFKKEFAKPPFSFIIKRIDIFDFKNIISRSRGEDTNLREDIQAVAPLIAYEAIVKIINRPIA